MAKELVVQENEMVARFNALRSRIGDVATSEAVDTRRRLDARLLQHIEFRAAELIDAVLG